MTTFEERARAEAETRYWIDNDRLPEPSVDWRSVRGFVAGALWAAAQSGEQPAAEAAPGADERALTGFALAARRAAQTTTVTTEQFDALPVGSVVLGNDGIASQRHEKGWACPVNPDIWWGGWAEFHTAGLTPLTLLYRPEAPHA